MSYANSSDYNLYSFSGWRFGNRCCLLRNDFCRPLLAWRTCNQLSVPRKTERKKNNLTNIQKIDEHKTSGKKFQECLNAIHCLPLASGVGEF